MLWCRQTAWAVLLMLALAVTSVSAGPPVGVVLRTGQRFRTLVPSARIASGWKSTAGSTAGPGTRLP
jgi:hypothetical protein